MAAQDEFAGEYQALADPESATAPGEAKHFKQILKHAATAAGDSQTTGNKEANCSRAISLLRSIDQWIRLFHDHSALSSLSMSPSSRSVWYCMFVDRVVTRHCRASMHVFGKA